MGAHWPELDWWTIATVSLKITCAMFALLALFGLVCELLLHRPEK